MLTLLEGKLNGQMLRYQAGHQMWCRGCETLLDLRDAVSVDLHRGDRLTGSVMYCGDCWDRAHALARSAAARKGLTLTITDGRTVDDDDIPCDPRGCVRLGRRGRFTTCLRGTVREEVRGIEVEFVGEDLPQIVRRQRWFAYRSGQRQWWIVHRALGLAACRGVTLAGALTRSVGVFRRAGEDKLGQTFNAEATP